MMTKYKFMRLFGRSALVVVFFAASACTTTKVGEIEEPVTSYAIGRVSGSYGSELPSDRLRHAAQHQVIESIGIHVERWMKEAGTWGGPDELRVTVERFRLPELARWASGQAKGNDYLGVDVSIIPETGETSQAFRVEHTIGAVDRSIAENYSAHRALENMIEHVAWSIVLEVTPMDRRMPVYAIGKREQIERAIAELELCGQMSYVELTKYGALGKVSVGLAAGAEARRAKWMFSDPEPCWTGGGDLEEARPRT